MYNKKGSALIIALVVLTLITMMSTVFFERVFRFSERSNGIENSNAAYYKALGMIEEALFTGAVNKYTPWNISDNTKGGTTSTGSKIIVGTGGTTIPIPGKGNSPYDKNYNIIALSEPVQVVIPNNILNWNAILFEFRVPIIGGNTNTGVAVAGTNSGYILWTLASSGASLFASGETNTFKGFQINSATLGDKIITSFNGTSNSGSAATFGSFYAAGFVGTNGADCTGYKCTLKLSLLRPVPTTDGRNMTFLEYKISGFSSSIPSQYIDIHAEGYSYGFLRSRDIQFPQITTNTALDFAVLQ